MSCSWGKDDLINLRDAKTLNPNLFNLSSDSDQKQFGLARAESSSSITSASALFRQLKPLHIINGTTSNRYSTSGDSLQRTRTAANIGNSLAIGGGGNNGNNGNSNSKNDNDDLCEGKSKPIGNHIPVKITPGSTLTGSSRTYVYERPAATGSGNRNALQMPRSSPSGNNYEFPDPKDSRYHKMSPQDIAIHCKDDNKRGRRPILNEESEVESVDIKTQPTPPVNMKPVAKKGRKSFDFESATAAIKGSPVLNSNLTGGYSARGKRKRSLALVHSAVRNTSAETTDNLFPQSRSAERTLVSRKNELFSNSSLDAKQMRRSSSSSDFPDRGTRKSVSNTQILKEGGARGCAIVLSGSEEDSELESDPDGDNNGGTCSDLDAVKASILRSDLGTPDPHRLLHPHTASVSLNGDIWAKFNNSVDAIADLPAVYAFEKDGAIIGFWELHYSGELEKYRCILYKAEGDTLMPPYSSLVVRDSGINKIHFCCHVDFSCIDYEMIILAKTMEIRAINSSHLNEQYGAAILLYAEQNDRVKTNNQGTRMSRVAQEKRILFGFDVIKNIR